jgi:hypothetical protein
MRSPFKLTSPWRVAVPVIVQGQTLPVITPPLLALLVSGGGGAGAVLVVVGVLADVKDSDPVVVVCFCPSVDVVEPGVVGPDESTVVDVSEEVSTTPEDGTGCEAADGFWRCCGSAGLDEGEESCERLPAEIATGLA